MPEAAAGGHRPVVRDETPADRAAVRRVETLAFGRREEAGLVDALRDHGRAALSLVAEFEGQVVGHVLFSPATLLPRREDLSVLALGPIAVLPAFQRRGVGSALVRQGLSRCVEVGVDCVILVGHEDYYARFGFVPAATRGLRLDDTPLGVRPSFQVAELRDGALDGVQARALFAPEFAAFE